MDSLRENKISITKSDVIWGYLAQFFNIGANIIILPVILNLLSSELLGIWYVFLTIGSFVTLLDFGFQPTFTRNVSFAFSGATSLQKEGIDLSQTILDRPNFVLLNNLIITMKRFYGVMSFIMFLFLISLGTFYIIYLSKNLNERSEIIIAWLIYIIATCLSFYYYYFNSLLQGRGLIKENNVLIIISKFVYIIFSVVGLTLGYGIISVSLATCLSIIVNRCFANYFFYKGDIKKKLGEDEVQTNKKSLFNIIWHNASKVGLANLAIFFTTKGNIFFVSYFLSLNVVASYGLTIQVVSLIAGISQLYFHTYIPLLSKKRIENNKNDLSKIFGEGLFIMIVSYCLMGILVVLLGNKILLMISSNTLLLPPLPLLLLLIIYLLDTNHSISLILLVTKNQVPYFVAAIISGIGIGIISPFLMGFLNWGVYGAIFAVGLVQILYHNWKWPVEVSKDLGISYFKFLRIGLKSIVNKLGYEI